MRRSKTSKKYKSRSTSDDKGRRDDARNLRDADEQKKEQLKDEWEKKFDEIGKSLGLTEEEIKRRMSLVTDSAGPAPNRFENKVLVGEVLESKVWGVKHELEHRLEFIKRQRAKNSSLHFNGIDKTYDKNLDKLFDFIIREEDGGTLEHLDYDDLFGPNGRLHENQYTKILDPMEALIYVSSKKVQRRTFWLMKDQVQQAEKNRKMGKPPKSRWRAGDTGYCSANLLEKDIDTDVFGYYVHQIDTFIPWKHVDNVREDLEPFEEALKIMSNYIMQREKSALTRDYVRRKGEAKTTRLRNPDSIFAQQRGPRKGPAIANSKPSIYTLKKNAIDAVSTINKSFMALKMNEFEKKWSKMVTYSALGLPKYQNAMWTVVRVLHSTTSLVFSNPGQFEYDPKSQFPFRSVDETISYADETFTNLITNFDINDGDGKLSPCKSFKVFMNQKMEREGVSAYKLRPYAFIFNSKTHIIKLVDNGAASLFYHYRHLYYAVDDIMSEIVNKLATTERELKRRILDCEKDDEVYGREEQIHPLVLPFLNFHEEVCNLRLKKRRLKRASFSDLEDRQFPYRDRIFLDAMLCSTRIVSNGIDIFAYFDQSGWEKQEFYGAGTETELQVGVEW